MSIVPTAAGGIHPLRYSANYKRTFDEAGLTAVSSGEWEWIKTADGRKHNHTWSHSSYDTGQCLDLNFAVTT